MQSEKIVKTKICLHCPEENRQPIEISNFSRHVLTHHNAKKLEKKKEGMRRARGFEFKVDFIWGSNIFRGESDSHSTSRQVDLTL